MAQGRSTRIIQMIKWIRTSTLSTKNSFCVPRSRVEGVGASDGVSMQASIETNRQLPGGRRPLWRQQPHICYHPPPHHQCVYQATVSTGYERNLREGTNSITFGVKSHQLRSETNQLLNENGGVVGDRTSGPSEMEDMPRAECLSISAA